MKYKFNYLKLRNQYFPIIPIKLVSKNNLVYTSALIDSGASICLFKSEIANQLGINLEKGKEILLEGISGKISIYIHSVSVEIENTKHIIPIGFSDEYTASFNLIGRKGFFDKFQINFNEKHLLVELNPY